MSIVQTYIDGLKRACYENEGKEIRDAFEKVFHGAEKMIWTNCVGGTLICPRACWSY